MADYENEKSFDNAGNDDVLSDLEALSKKYGLSFNGERYRTPPPAAPYSPYTAPDVKKIQHPPKNNRPARTPRIVYDTSAAYPAVRIVYGDEEPTVTGPEGRRVIYQENETENIAAKRRRNAEAAQQRAVPSDFGNQPYTRKVAGAPDAFTSAYLSNKKSAENRQKKPETAVSITQMPVKKAEKAAPAKESKKPIHQHYEITAKDRVRNFFKAFIPWKGDPAKEVIRKLIMNISAILVLACFGFFINNYIEYRNQLKIQADLDNMRQEEPVSDDLEVQWAAIRAKYPDVDFPEGMNIKWAELYAQNQDFVGWLNVPGTSIDTSVVKSPNDDYKDANGEDFYLHHDFFKEYSKYGNAYLDTNNTGSALDRNNVIYGHNMTDGLSFAQLEKYYKIDGFRRSPIIKYSTLFNDYYFKVYAVIITNGYPQADNGYLFNYITTGFTNDDTFRKFIEALDERKLYDTGVDANKDDIFLTLSTCSYEIKATDMGRLAVIGRLVRNGESTEVDTSKAVENTNIRYPQIWYDEHNQTNPFANAYQWYP